LKNFEPQRAPAIGHRWLKLFSAMQARRRALRPRSAPIGLKAGADDRLLVRLLQHLLPPYQGEATTLFRGENVERFEARRVGFAWSSRIEVARMFGRGLNSVPCGGVLLRARFEPTAIVCGSPAQSQYLGEDQCTIDPFAGTVVTAVERFPVAHP
jgi:hypothetical protein